MVGTSKGYVNDILKKSKFANELQRPETITNSRGQERPTTYKQKPASEFPNLKP